MALIGYKPTPPFRLKYPSGLGLPAPINPGGPPDAFERAAARGAPGVVQPNPAGDHFPGIKTPGYTPNYTDLLNQDPGLMATRNNNQFALAQAAAGRDATVNKLNYGYGGAGNRFSTLAQLAKQLKDTIFQGTKGNAAAGALHSGEQPYMEQNANYAHDLGNYDASRSLEDQINAAMQQYLGVAQDASSSESQAISDAIQRNADNPLYHPKDGYAGYDEELSKQYGSHIYKDMSGKYWTLDENGNTVPFTP